MSDLVSLALPAEQRRDYLQRMKMTRESPEDGTAVARGEQRADAAAAFTSESIQRVRDFTARKTLEQALSFVTGLQRLFDESDPDEADRTLRAELGSVGISARDAEIIAHEALDLMDLMADRDRKAEIFHAAVKEAGQGERAMYERLAAVARILRARLGGRSPSLEKLGVPPDPKPTTRTRIRGGKGIFSALAVKQ
jgi:hypothetical protein